MWFKYFNKEAWRTRVFRTRNLKFDNDNIGAFKFSYSSKLKMMIYKMLGNEGAIRISAWAFWFPLLGVLGYIDGRLNGEARLEQARLAKIENDKETEEVYETFWKNR